MTYDPKLPSYSRNEKDGNRWNGKQNISNDSPMSKLLKTIPSTYTKRTNINKIATSD